ISNFKLSHLTHVELSFGSNVSFSSLEMLLKEHSHSLKTLQLYFPNSSNNTNNAELQVFETFPFKKLHLPELNTLSVSQEILRGLSFPLCLEKMGSLKSLKLWDATNEFN